MPAQLDASPVRDEIQDVMRDVRAAFGQLLASVHGSPTRVSEVERALRLRKTLAWRVVQVASSDDPLQAADTMLGPEGVRLLIDAGRSAGASADALAAVDEACRRYHSLIGRHAPSRPALRRLLSSMAENGRERFDLTMRRQAMEANSAIWGVHARVQLRLGIIWRGGHGPAGTADMAVVFGMDGFTRMREGVEWELRRAQSMRSHGKPEAQTLEPISIESGTRDPSQAAVLPGFCSGEGARVIRRVDKTGAVVDTLASGQVGMSGAVSVYMGEIMPGLIDDPIRPGETDFFAFAMRLRAPTDVAVCELHVQRLLWPEPDVQAAVVDELQSSIAYPNPGGIEPPTLPVEAAVECRGGVDRLSPMLEAPRYRELLDHVYAKLGADQREFDSYLLRIKYPPVPSKIMLRIPFATP